MPNPNVTTRSKTAAIRKQEKEKKKAKKNGGEMQPMVEWDSDSSSVRMPVRAFQPVLLEGKIKKVFTKSAVRRIARRGGAKRISSTLYNEVRSVLNSFITGLKYDSIAFTDLGKRKTVIAMDVVHALRRRGRILYGYE